VLRDAGQPVPTEVLFPYPHPKILGLAMDPQRRATVARVEPGSAADRAGLEAGDELESVDGQSIVSTADIQWALHQLTDDEAVAIAARRDGEPLEASLALEPGWRARGDISWRATSWALRRMVAGGLKLDELPREERAARQLADDALALEVAHVGQYGEHAHAKRQGFREGDVIVAIDGRDRAMRESDLFAALVNKPVGERVSVDVLRGSEKLELNLVMQK
jgi:S1-C subfamily serine protease